MDYLEYKNYLAHHGILGMHWGIRRYQNKDGSYTAEGLKRYGIKDTIEIGKKQGVRAALNSDWDHTSPIAKVAAVALVSGSAAVVGSKLINGALTLSDLHGRIKNSENLGEDLVTMWGNPEVSRQEYLDRKLKETEKIQAKRRQTETLHQTQQAYLNALKQQRNGIHY